MEPEIESEVEEDLPQQHCTACDELIDTTDLEPLSVVGCPTCGADVKVNGRVDHFELEAVAGRGGMGVVYKAKDTQLDRRVALKLLRKDHTDNPTFIKQFETEAAITASINHPHVVKVYSTGSAHGQFYIVMELVDRGSLDDLIRIQGFVSEAQVLEVGIHIAQGLNAAHEHGLIHRDVKPGNILFADAHTAKIVDFGLAIFMSQEESVRGEIWGTPYYVAPEKLDDKPEDFRSDIYSLGATLFHALAGRPPFEAENASMLALKHLKSQPVSLQAFAPHVSGRTNYIINRTLLKDPNQRYSSYKELIEHLSYAREELLAEAGSKPIQTRVVLENAEQQRAWGWLTAALIGLILAVLTGLYFFQDRLKAQGDGPTGPAIRPVDIVDEPASTGTTPLDLARKKLIEGNAAQAAVDLRKVADNSSESEDARSWATLLEGIAQMQDNKPQEAKASFTRLASRSEEFLKKRPDDSLQKFFLAVSRELLSDKQVLPPKSYPDRTNPDAFGLFAYGLKNWKMGKCEEAAVFFREFRWARPTSQNAWIADFKKLASSHIDELTLFQMAADQLKAAKTDAAKQQSLATLNAARGPLKERAQALINASKVPAQAPKK